MMSNTDLTNQQKLEEVYELTLENNSMLRSMRRQQHIANAFRFIYWLVILGVLGGAYYYVRPVISSITNNKDKINETLQQFEGIRSQFPETKLFEQFFHLLKERASSTASSSPK